MTSSQDIEEGYSPRGEFHNPNLLRVSPEQRLIMRNIPFFVLPPHETTPRTSHVGPKVDTHNTSYVPAQPRNVGKPYAQKLDYSQVKSRIDTGRSTSPAAHLESTSKAFGHSSHIRPRINAHRFSSPSAGLSKSRVSAGHSSLLSSKSDRLNSPRSADYSRIKSRIDAGSRPSSVSSAKSEKLSLSAGSDLKSRISSTVATTGGQTKLSSSPLPDYSHIKSRTDSGQRPRSRSSGSPRSSSMSHNKAKAAEDTKISSQAVKFGSPSHRLPRTELPRSRVPLSDTFPIKARKSSPAGAVNRYRGVTGFKFGSPEKHHQKSGNSQGSINNSVTRQLEPEFGRVSPSRSFPQDTQDKIPTRGPVNYSAKAKSRIDCSDPNPSAHKLKHSLNELIVPLGRDINPRFSSSGKTTRIVKSSSFHVEKPADKTESESSLVKSSTFESLFEVGSGVPDLESEIKKATQDSTNPIESASSTPLALEDSPAMEVGLETVHHCHKLGWTEEYAVNGGHDVTFSKTYSTQGEKHEATVNTPAYNDNQRLTGESVTPTYHEDNNADTFGEYHPDDTAPSHSRHDEGDLRVVDFEVTNSETETTVVLKHLLALSSLSKEKETNEATDNNGNGTNSHVRRSTGSSSLWTMPSIEESDSEESESYYESEEVVTTPPLPIVPYTLPIPTINLQDEDGTVLETILQGTEGLKSEEDGTDATCTVDGGNGLVANYSPKTVYDDELGPSTKL